MIEKLLTAFIQPLQQDNISTTHPRAEYERAAALAADSSSSSPLLILGPTGEPASSSSSSILGPDWPECIYRVHCSLNLNTETGRLSARRPNLQNQPALEKDRYKVSGGFVRLVRGRVCVQNLTTRQTTQHTRVREDWLLLQDGWMLQSPAHGMPVIPCDWAVLTAEPLALAPLPLLPLPSLRVQVRKAFCAEPGKALVVADYGQLELRLLAHMANCRSMITAFELGGDFHSRCASFSFPARST